MDLSVTKGPIMWFLLMIMLAPPLGVDRVTILNTFVTYEDCKPERDRIGFEMAERYPYENDFRIECEFRDTQPPKWMVYLDQLSGRPASD